jgi:hypothetical protein
MAQGEEMGLGTIKSCYDPSVLFCENVERKDKYSAAAAAMMIAVALEEQKAPAKIPSTPLQPSSTATATRR